MNLEKKHPVAAVHAEEAAYKITSGLEAVGEDMLAQREVIETINYELEDAGVSVVLVPALDEKDVTGKRAGLSRDDIFNPRRLSDQRRNELRQRIRASFDTI
jgi:hypothetical protein